MTDPPGAFRGCGLVTVFREVSSRRQAKWTFLSRSASSTSRNYDDLIFNQPSAGYGGVVYALEVPRRRTVIAIRLGNGPMKPSLPPSLRVGMGATESGTDPPIV